MKQGSPELSRRVTVLECLSFDPFSLFDDDGGGSAGAGIGRRDVVEVLVVSLVVVMLDERLDLSLKITG